MKKFLVHAVALFICNGLTLAVQAQSKDVRPNVTSLSTSAPLTDSGNANLKSQESSEPSGGSATASSNSGSPLVANGTGSSYTLSDNRVTPTSATPVDAASRAGDASASRAPTELYKVGVGDVLDIVLLNSPTRDSTLFTVLEGGLLEYPLAGEAVRVEGFTTDEIDAALTKRIKIFASPEVVVSVREYLSHNVIVTGLVNEPGTHVLRREAVPLYVVLAESQPRIDAGRVTIMRAGSPTMTLDLLEASSTTTLIYPGDVIRVSSAPPPAPQFFYIGGQINSPGQKDFHSGMTLTQAIFASGGVTRGAGSKIKVMRQADDQRLVTTEYNLKRIEDGKDPDPKLLAGDRIEVSRAGWRE